LLLTQAVLLVRLSSEAAFSVPAGPAAGRASSDLMQFTADGHVFGFSTDGYYLTNAAYALRVQFVEANDVQPVREDQASVAHKNAGPLHRVTYRHLWPGITLIYEGVGDGLARSTYQLEPWSDVQMIRLRYNLPVTLNADGSLNVTFATGSIDETAPVAWQEIDGQRVPVTAQFVDLGEHEVGFALGAYDRSFPLTIDPTLRWNTFLGDRDPGDYGRAIVVAGNGNVYVVGTSAGAWGTPIRASHNNPDAFVAGLDANGTLLWNTFLGGNNTDSGSDIALDSNGNILVTGFSNGTWGEPVRAFTGSNNDAFVAKLDPFGVLLWNTFLGGNGGDSGLAIAVDAADTARVAGTSTATWGTPIRPYSGGYNDAFAVGLSPSGVLLWNTFLGGSGDDQGHDIALDTVGNAIVVGVSSATWAAPVHPFSGGSYDTLVAKLGANGDLTLNTFLGGAGDDRGLGVAVDNGGNVYVTGSSTATWGAPLRAFSVSPDSSVAKLDASGALLWNTFLGGSGADQSFGIEVDSSANIFVIGTSAATWGAPVQAYAAADDILLAKLSAGGALAWNTFLGSSSSDTGAALSVTADGILSIMGTSGATWGPPISPYTGGNDALVARLASDGAPVWHTFLGASGSGDDTGVAIAVDNAGNLFVSGNTHGSWGAPVRAFSGGTDAFVVKLSANGALLWNTFLGGSLSDNGNAVDIDANGNVYVSGDSNATWGAPNRPYSGAYDAFVAKLAPNGALVWNTFLGASASDTSRAVAVAPDGNLVVSGDSSSAWGAPIRPYGSSVDTFVAMLDAGGALVWNTFLGGGSSDNGFDMTTDSAGNVYVAGTSGNTWGAPVRPFSGIIAGYVAKLNQAGVLAWNTFLGSGNWLSGYTYGRTVAVDLNGNIFVAGTSDNPWGAPTRPFGGISDAFVAKLGASGNLLWNTFLGSSLTDNGSSIEAGPAGNAYVTGYSSSTWGTPVRPHNGSSDAFVASLDSDGALAWHSFLGGSGSDRGNAIAIGSITTDDTDLISVAGTSDTLWGTPVRPFGGGTTDAFVAQIDSVPLAVVLAQFDARAQTDHVAVDWETASEIDNTGFNLYRSPLVDGPRELLAFIPAQAPGSTQGFSYNYADFDVQPGQTYYYWLEDIDLNNVATRHGPVSVTFDNPTAVSLTRFSAVPAVLPAARIVAVVLATALGAFAAVRRRQIS
jgi:hypothetical protein